MGFQLSKRAAIVNILAHFAAFDGVYVRLIYYVSHLVPIFFFIRPGPDLFSFFGIFRVTWVTHNFLMPPSQKKKVHKTKYSYIYLVFQMENLRMGSISIYGGERMILHCISDVN